MVLCNQSLAIFIIIVVAITTQPMNVTVCLTQSTIATFICEVDTGGLNIGNAGWRILDEGRYLLADGLPRHMSNRNMNGNILTDTLTVINVSVNDNGAQYQCEPDDGVNRLMSIPATLTVLGEIII